MTYKGIMKGETIELEERLPYLEGEPVSISVEPFTGQPNAGSPAAIRQMIHELTIPLAYPDWLGYRMSQW